MIGCRVEDSRKMIRQNKEEDVERARRLIKAADQKSLERLGRAEITDSEVNKRLLI